MNRSLLAGSMIGTPWVERALKTPLKDNALDRLIGRVTGLNSSQTSN